MSSVSATTNWTNKTLDLLKNRLHIQARQIPESLIDGTIKTGFRMISQQTKASKGVRHIRLDAWYYIRKLNANDICKALEDEGRLSRPLRSEIEQIMQEQAVYHVVVRGNDKRFMPLGDLAGADLVTQYFAENLEIVREEVDKYLFDDLEDPQAISLAMSNPLFDDMLKAYFESGDTKKKETLHLVSRMRGGANLLHTCIKENHIDTLKLLLDQFTIENQAGTPWRVLAEPLRSVGEYKISAFHRAVFDGRKECLECLVAWARLHEHDISQLKNVEEVAMGGKPLQEYTCLELAEAQGNWSCYNILADLFGAAPKALSDDSNTREVRLALLSQPRVELTHRSSGVLKSVILPQDAGMTWSMVADVVQQVTQSPEFLQAEPNDLTVSIHRVNFADDITSTLAEFFYDHLRGVQTFSTEACAVHTDRTQLVWLETLVERLRIKSALPLKLDVSSKPSEPLAPTEQHECDRRASDLLGRLVALSGTRPAFLGARNGVISSDQAIRLSQLSDNGLSTARRWAAVYAARIHTFCFFSSEDLHNDLEDWLRMRSLMPLPRMIFKGFWNISSLLEKEFPDPRKALQPEVVIFLDLTLASWFCLSKEVSTSEGDPWTLWGKGLGVDESFMKQKLAPALDIVLATLLRMNTMLDFACQRAAHLIQATSIVELVRKHVPGKLLESGRLPMTLERISRVPDRPDVDRTRISLIQTNVPMRPMYGRKAAVQ